MIAKLLGLIIFISCSMAFAQHEVHEVAGEAAEHDIPWLTIWVQAYNVILLAALLIYLLRRAVIEHFEGRLKAYTELVERAENAKAAAQKSHREIAQRLHLLQANADQSLQQAKLDAAALKTKMIADAQVLSKRMQEDAERTIDLEIDRAKNELRAELLRSSIEASRESLQKTIGSTEQKRLQTEFVDKIQMVGR
jgi:F-type H+-transporting ATPase subunit b